MVWNRELCNPSTLGDDQRDEMYCLLVDHAKRLVNLDQSLYESKRTCVCLCVQKDPAEPIGYSLQRKFLWMLGRLITILGVGTTTPKEKSWSTLSPIFKCT